MNNQRENDKKQQSKELYYTPYGRPTYSVTW